MVQRNAVWRTKIPGRLLGGRAAVKSGALRAVWKLPPSTRTTQESDAPAHAIDTIRRTARPSTLRNKPPTVSIENPRHWFCLVPSLADSEVTELEGCQRIKVSWKRLVAKRWNQAEPAGTGSGVGSVLRGVIASQLATNRELPKSESRKLGLPESR